MHRLEFFAFRYRDSRTGKWVRARHRCELHELQQRYAEFEIIGEPEVRNVDPDARYNPQLAATPGKHRPVKDAPKNPPPVPQKDPPKRHPPVKEPPDEDPATLDGLERFLLLVFLRRYITYCARRRLFAAMNGAARLFRELSASGR
jgi:hypothetical protein